MQDPTLRKGHRAEQCLAGGNLFRAARFARHHVEHLPWPMLADGKADVPGARGLRTNLFALRRCAVAHHLYVPFPFPVAAGRVSRHRLMVLTHPSCIGEPIEIVLRQERHEHE